MKELLKSEFMLFLVAAWVLIVTMFLGLFIAVSIINFIENAKVNRMRACVEDMTYEQCTEFFDQKH